jgi:hypothetical protein
VSTAISTSGVYKYTSVRARANKRGTSVLYLSAKPQQEQYAPTCIPCVCLLEVYVYGVYMVCVSTCVCLLEVYVYGVYVYECVYLVHKER